MHYLHSFSDLQHYGFIENHFNKVLVETTLIEQSHAINLLEGHYKNGLLAKN